MRLAQLAQGPGRVLVLAREHRVRLLEPLVLPGETDSGVLAVHAGEGALEGGVGRHDQPHLARRSSPRGSPRPSRPSDPPGPPSGRRRPGRPGGSGAAARTSSGRATRGLRSMENRSRSTNATSSWVHSASLSISSLTKPSWSSASPSRSPVRRWWSTPELELRLADHVGLDEDVAQPVLLVVPVQHRLQIGRGEGPLLHEKLPDRRAVGLASCARSARVSCASVTSPSRSRSSPSRRVRGGDDADATRLDQTAAARPPRGRCRNFR